MTRVANGAPPSLTLRPDGARRIIMNALKELARNVVIVALGVSSIGCSELRARQLAREGNSHFRAGDYAAAVRAYASAQELHPLPVVAFNHGLACRQLMLPGAKSAENERAVQCALSAFSQLKRLDPADERAEQLYQQTLFDADKFDRLAEIYTEQLRSKPNEPVALNALVQVYLRWGKWDEALRWTIERAQRNPADAEAHYTVGVLIYTRLFEKGGGPDQSSFDPRPQGAEQKLPPPTLGGDIVAEERVRLADLGISHLKKAIELRPSYADALIYLGLLYRQKSFAYFERPAEWQTAVDAAEAYRKQAMALHVASPPPRP
jgi:tetratricopeptide (TPR) repeat protein